MMGPSLHKKKEIRVHFLNPWVEFESKSSFKMYVP